MEIPPSCVTGASLPAAPSTRGVCVCVCTCVPALRPQAGEGTLNQNPLPHTGTPPQCPRRSRWPVAEGGPTLQKQLEGINLFFATARHKPIRADPAGALVLGEENTRRVNPGMLILAGTFQLPAGESPGSQEGGQDLGLLAASLPHCPLFTPTQTHGWFQRASGKACVFLPQGLRSWESGPGMRALPPTCPQGHPSPASLPRGKLAVSALCCWPRPPATGAPGGHWEDSRPWGLHSSPAQGLAVRVRALRARFPHQCGGVTRQPRRSRRGG